MRRLTNRTYTLEEAVELLLEQTPAPEVFSSVPLLDALGRVVSGDCSARIDQPPFHRSPLDGYAARHEDLAAASPENPVFLTVTQKIYAGDTPGKPIGSGEAAQIATGAPLPSGVYRFVLGVSRRFAGIAAQNPLSKPFLIVNSARVLSRRKRS